MKLIECPRDAMQGMHEFIPTSTKINYINSLLNLGFDSIDFGSFVSAKAIPQLRDTAEVLRGLNLNTESSKLLAIIANTRGAQDACLFDEISYLGFPFSISETFQLRNTNATIQESLVRVEEIKKLTDQHHKELVVYISMGFGNPYGEEWSVEVVEKWTKKLSELGIKILAFSDTTGVSNVENIDYLFRNITPLFPNVEFGAHLHTRIEDNELKLKAAWDAGCRRFDSAIKGFGGCPMASDSLTGNMATENVLSFFNSQNIKHPINELKFNESLLLANEIFQN